MTVADAHRHLREIAERASSFGHVRQPDGAERYGHVPHVAPEAWFHVIFPPLDGAGIDGLERELGRPLPSAYREWLTLANGLHMFTGLLTLCGLRTDYSRDPERWLPFHVADIEVRERPEDAPDRAFFVGSSDWWTPQLAWHGSNLWIDDADGSLHLSPRRTAASIERWASLPEALVDLCDRLDASFDDRGKLVVDDLAAIGEREGA